MFAIVTHDPMKSVKNEKTSILLTECPFPDKHHFSLLPETENKLCWFHNYRQNVHLELDTALSLKPTTLNFTLLSSHLLFRLNIIFISQWELHVQTIVNLRYFYFSNHTHHSVQRFAVWWTGHFLFPLKLKQFITHRVFWLLQYTFFSP